MSEIIDEINRKKSLNKILFELQLKKYKRACKSLKQYLSKLRQTILKNLKYSGLSEDDIADIIGYIDKIKSSLDEVEYAFRSLRTFIIMLREEGEELNKS